MQEIDTTSTDTTQAHAPMANSHWHPLLRRLTQLGAFLLLLVVIPLVLPFVNVNRYQRRIVSSLGESLGRPIHLDRISLTVFPLPGLTIENLVVSEDPAFGSEPFIRASTVRATLRISSLWRRRIEFTRIRFTDPSINLVKLNNGKWNLESILLQAAKIDAAPTAQARASAAPRFPYIEATNARLNLKLDREKTPFSLAEADLALWLNSPQEWRLRLEGKPARTDTNVSETGLLRLEGTLGRAASLANVPIDLKANWANVPLGEASRVLLGHDAGLRGAMTLTAVARGTIAKSTLQTTLHLADARRADFVPLQTFSADLECQAIQTSAFEAISDLRCSWPPALSPLPKTIALVGSIPDTRHLATSSFELGTPGIPASQLLAWLRIGSNRISPSLAATGILTGSLFLQPADDSTHRWSGQLNLPQGTLTVPTITATPIFSGALSLRSSQSGSQNSGFILAPVPLTLGGRDFATLDGHFDRLGYTLHFTGTSIPAKLLALGSALPPIGDGLSAVLPAADSINPIRFDLTSTRAWTGSQTWRQSTRPPVTPRHFLHR